VARSNRVGSASCTGRAPRKAVWRGLSRQVGLREPVIRDFIAEKGDGARLCRRPWHLARCCAAADRRVPPTGRGGRAAQTPSTFILSYCRSARGAGQPSVPVTARARTSARAGACVMWRNLAPTGSFGGLGLLQEKRGTAMPALHALLRRTI